MKTRFYFTLWLCITVVLSLGLSGCSVPASADEPSTQRSLLSEFEQNDVRVEIALEYQPGDVDALLLATFTPLIADGHMYSKDLPFYGVDGVGRPTLLELTDNSLLTAAGPLTANQSVITPTLTVDGGANPPYYPIGPVTLSLPVILPTGDGSPVNDQIQITYMACGPLGCKPPVMGLILDIEVPTAAE